MTSHSPRRVGTHVVADLRELRAVDRSELDGRQDARRLSQLGQQRAAGRAPLQKKLYQNLVQWFLIGVPEYHSQLAPEKANRAIKNRDNLHCWFMSFTRRLGDNISAESYPTLCTNYLTSRTTIKGFNQNISIPRAKVTL